MQEIQRDVFKFLTEYGFQIVGALIILAIGAFVARWIGRLAQRWLEGRQIEPPIRSLTVRILRLLVFGLAVVLALDKFGVPITPMIAGIGVVGVGIGLATQSVLSNVVAGLTIIFVKPFRVGEYIDIAGEEGEVIAIELFSTTLLHTDRSRVVIPNRKIVGEILHNFGATRQLNLRVGLAYGTDMNKAIRVIQELLAADPRVLKDPQPVVGIGSLSAWSVEIFVRPWVSVKDYVVAGQEINKRILEAMATQGLKIPLPQQELRVLNLDNDLAAPITSPRARTEQL